jgi:hypothetical protein
MARKTTKKTAARKTTRKPAAKKTAKFVKLTKTKMKELAGKYTRSRDKRKARPKLLKKYGKVQTAAIVAMAKKMEAAAAKKTTSSRTKKSTSTRARKTSSARVTTKKTTSSRTKKSAGRVKQGNKLAKLMEGRAKKELKARKNALIAAYKRSAYAKNPTRKNWNKFVKTCGNVQLAGMVKKLATK